MTDEDERSVRFGRYFRAHSRPVLGFALRRAATPADAADVVAETFVVAWRRIDEVPDEPETLLWLYGVARNVIANQRRGHRRRRRLAERLRHDVVAEASTVEPLPDPDRARQVAAAMKVLRDVEREVLTMTVAEGLAPSEVALALGLRAETVRTHLHRARLKLRTALRNGAEIDVKRDGWSGHGVSRRHHAARDDFGEQL